MRLFAFCIFNMIVDNNLLQDVLRKFENSDNIFITDVLTSPACEKGQNFVSRVSKVTVRGFKRTKENVISGMYRITNFLKLHILTVPQIIKKI